MVDKSVSGFSGLAGEKERKSLRRQDKSWSFDVTAWTERG